MLTYPHIVVACVAGGFVRERRWRVAKQDEKLHRSSLEHFCKRLGTCSDGIGIWDFALITLIYRGDPFVFRLQGGGRGGRVGRCL